MGKPKQIDDEQDEKPGRDTRPVVRESQVLAGLLAAAEAMRSALVPSNMGPSTPPRWGVHEAWGRLRAAYHATTPDAVRRECLARLVAEEAARIEHDESVSLSNRATSKRGGG
jgi:hypothetical protein